jgi:hypothetical protein
MPGRFRSNMDREAAYEIKTKPERVKQVSDDIRERALQRHSEKQTALTSYELQAKEAIDKTGVSTPLYVAYLNYCREIWKKSNTYGGAVLKKETDAIIAKWKARELDEKILKQLRFELINVQA